MNRPFDRRRRVTAGVALGMWLFALFVGFAQACDWHVAIGGADATYASRDSAAPPHGAGRADCEQFCATNVPVVAKLPLIGGQWDSSPLVPSLARAHFAPAIAPPPLPAIVVRPVSGVPPFLRVSRLRL